MSGTSSDFISIARSRWNAPAPVLPLGVTHIRTAAKSAAALAVAAENRPTTPHFAADFSFSRI